MITTKEAAARLGISRRRVNDFINEARLPAEQFGRDHLIKESDLKLVEDRQPGRPPQKGGKKKTGITSLLPNAPGVTPSKEKILRWDKKGSKK